MKAVSKVKLYFYLRSRAGKCKGIDFIDGVKYRCHWNNPLCEKHKNPPDWLGQSKDHRVYKEGVVIEEPTELPTWQEKELERLIHEAGEWEGRKNRFWRKVKELTPHGKQRNDKQLL